MSAQFRADWNYDFHHIVRDYVQYLSLIHISFGNPRTFGLVSAGLVSARVNTRESSNGVSVGKPGHITKLRHELRAERITYAVHGPVSYTHLPII